MANIQKTLDNLQPYVVGIRYVEGTPIVDAIFNDGWVIPDDKEVKKLRNDESVNYFILYTDTNGGVDVLLAYVERVIKLNKDREMKQELLRKKVGELKDLFLKTPLKKLYSLKFAFPEEDLVPNLNEFEVEEVEIETPQLPEEKLVQEIIEPQVEVVNNQPIQYLDENKQPIPLTEEEEEMLEEERRAERNRKLVKKTQTTATIAKKIELPPKRRLATEVVTKYTDCDCGPDAACEKCIDSKDF